MNEHSLQRRFSDEEVQDLIRRALALQEKSSGGSSAVSHPEGLSLDEVRQIASEVGIDPRFVELAASTSGNESERISNWFAGGAYRWRFQQSVPGEMTDVQRARLIDEIRRTIGRAGEVRDLYGTMEWTHDDGLGPISVGVRSTDGRTEVDVSGNRSGSVGLLHSLSALGGGMGLGAVTAGALGIGGVAVLPVILGATAVSYLVSRAAWGLRAGVWERRLGGLARRAADAAAEAAVLPSSDTPTEP